MNMKEAIESVPEAIPMEAEIWAAGVDHETARFAAERLRDEGYYLVRADDIGWPEINTFNAELRKGQSVYEDAGGFFVRCIMAMFGKKPDEVVSYQKAAEALLKDVAAKSV